MSTSTILMLLAFVVLYKIMDDRKPARARASRHHRDEDGGRWWNSSGKFWGFTAGCHDVSDGLGLGESDAGESSKRERELEAQIEALEERIKVLERIVTDRGFDVAEEIDRL